MKTMLLTIAFTVGLLIHTLAGIHPVNPITPPADSAGYKLTVVLNNVAQRTGMLYIGIDNSDATFNKDSYRKTRIAVPATGEVQVSFDGLPAGRYSVRVYQDLNANQKLDFSGPMPTEPFGFSNVKMLMSPPTFNQCAFALDGSKTVEIYLFGN